MKAVAIVQARMGSSRLPGKVLRDLCGATVLARVVRRLRGSKLLDGIAVATTTSQSDDPIAEECNRLQVACLRGSEPDVLDRYYQAASSLACETVARITADCPLIDAGVADAVLHQLTDQGADYASNVLVRTYPRGLDVEAFTRPALERAWREAREPHQREHVTPYFYEHPEIFRLASVRGASDHSAHRWTLDVPEDLQLLRAIYLRFDGRDDFTWEQALQLVELEPELAELNSHVLQKPVREG